MEDLITVMALVTEQQEKGSLMTGLSFYYKRKSCHRPSGRTTVKIITAIQGWMHHFALLGMLDWVSLREQ
jgi:hypothetical protein